MKARSNQLELMDLGPAYYTVEEYKDCLHKLGIIGTLLGGDQATLSAFAQLPSSPLSILDVGCGNGAFACKLARYYPQAHVVGIDIAPEAIALAQQYSSQNPHLLFEYRQSPELSEPAKSYDVITATLLCHHLTNEQFIQFLQAANTIARKAIILNDLQRHWLAYMLFWLISPLFNNRLIRYDGLLSIKRGFTRPELVDILKAAGFASRKYKIEWKWAFRWVITIDCT